MVKDNNKVCVKNLADHNKLQFFDLQLKVFAERRSISRVFALQFPY